MSVSTHFSLTSGLRSAWITIAVLCAIANLLALTGAIYALQVYDRVLSSQSIPTLVTLSVIAFGFYLAIAGIDRLRAAIMLRVAACLDDRAICATQYSRSVQLFRDADTVRHFLSGPGPVAFFDLPWVPCFVAFVFLIDPTLAIATIVGIGVLVLIAVAYRFAGARAEVRAIEAGQLRNATIDAMSRHPAVAPAAGLAQRERVLRRHHDLAEAQFDAAAVEASCATVSRLVRQVLQSAMTGLGAYLAIHGNVSVGAMIAASIIAARAVTPVEQAIIAWRPFTQFCQAVRRLKAAAAAMKAEHASAPGNPPRRSLALTSVSAVATGSAQVILRDVDLCLSAGSVTGVVGANGTGKSLVGLILAGSMRPARGSVLLDEVPLTQWPPNALGDHIGYLPQETVLFPGTIAENIARSVSESDTEAVAAAARAADIHEMIIRLPLGYDTHIGDGAEILSAGQRQRIALARALYRNPFVVIFDEPGNHLDAAGEAALIRAIQNVRARKGIAVLIAQRSRLLATADTVLELHGGRLMQHEVGVLRSNARSRGTSHLKPVLQPNLTNA